MPLPPPPASSPSHQGRPPQVWRRGQPPAPVYPWARESLLVERAPHPAGGGGGGGPRTCLTRVLDRTRSPPAVIAEYEETLG
jgi:hypothetical protein